MSDKYSDVRYLSGDEIHAGDRVSFGGKPATVVAVFKRSEFAGGAVREEWLDYHDGLLLRDDAGELFMNQYADEDVKLVSRSQ